MRALPLSRRRRLGPALALCFVGCAARGPQAARIPTIIGASPNDTIVLIGEPRVIATLPDVEPGRFDTGKMWTFENPPLDYFAAEYGFRPSEAWLTGLRLAALRLPNCTASFVSPDGLVLTNHHCAREGATAVARQGEDLITDGFFAAAQGDERQVPDLYVDQLVEIHDVTAEVHAAVDPGQPEEAQVEARDARVAEVQQRLSQSRSLSCEVTSLYHGGKYSSYCYRRYEDVRLVFLPELTIGYFGGDPDNFTFPRYVLDVSFFRVYGPDGRPLRTEAFLPWNAAGPAAGEPVFVVGNPGSTTRLNTVAQLEYRRDAQTPFTVRLLESRAAILQAYMAEQPEERSTYLNDYFSITNSLKAYTGELRGLRTPELMARKVAFERRFRDAVERDSALARQFGGLWDEIADIRAQIGELAPTLNALNQGGLLRSRTLETAATMVQYGRAASGGFAPDSILRAVRAELEATQVNRMLDARLLAAQLEDAVSLLGADDEFVQEALRGRSPTAAADAIVHGSVVPDSAPRSVLLANPAHLMASLDPALRLIQSFLPRLQQVVQEYQRLVAAEEVRTSRLARALFEVHGTDIPPDATFTLRIADGVVRGYQYNGTEAPSFTTFYGLWDRHHSQAGREEWALPARWLKPPAAFDPGTPLNFVSTNDIIGGNSGSPVVNRAGELVGLIFDGNIESLPGDFIYTTETSRAISVHSAGILEALRDMYGATRIVDELDRARRP
ncbi:MAG TPA: S46 family peptidase [Gemmatimonadales bacterium]